MGKELTCTIRIDGVAGRAKAHLDSNALRISGDHRLLVPLDGLKQAVLAGATLRLRSREGLIELDLGPEQARQWHTAIVSPKTVLQKIGVRASDRVFAKGMPDCGFLDDLGSIVESPIADKMRGEFDVMFLGVENVNDLNDVSRMRKHLAPAGALWVLRPKGKASLASEAQVREAIQKQGLFEAKVVAFSDTHTAMKAMIPLSERPKAKRASSPRA